MKRLLPILLILAILAPLAACHKRVVGRSGIGDPLYKDRPHETNRNEVGKKYDDGENER